MTTRKCLKFVFVWGAEMSLPKPARKKKKSFVEMLRISQLVKYLSAFYVSHLYAKTARRLY
jgi:hypothetical protein